MNGRRAAALGAGMGISAAVIGAACLSVLLALVGSSPSGDDLASEGAWAGRTSDPTAGDRAAMTPDDATAVSLLARAASAATALSYAGTAVTIGPSGSTQMSLHHMPGHGTVVIRGAGSVMLPDDDSAGTPVESARVLVLLADNFRVVRESALDQRIAGRPAAMVEARRVAGTVAARFWLDTDTGLLLRRDVVGVDGSLVSRSLFSTLTLHPASPAHLPPLAASDAGTVLSPGELQAARDHGCVCPGSLPGGLTLIRAREVSQPAVGPSSSVPASVVHLLYSDGLEQVSLFSQPGYLADGGRADLKARGFASMAYDGSQVLSRVSSTTCEYVWESQESVLTWIGPAGPDGEASGRASVAALSVGTAVEEPSFWSHVARGAQRVQAKFSRSWDDLTASTSSPQESQVP